MPVTHAKGVGMKKEVEQIFKDLEAYRDFCRFEGFKYDEADLYKNDKPWGKFVRRRNRAQH